MEIKSLASVKKRFIGGFIDLLIVIIASSILMALFVFTSTPHPGYSSQMVAATNKATGFLCGLSVDAIYTIFLMSSNMQCTFGQKAVGIKVVKMNGDPITIFNSLIRYIVSIFSTVFLKLGYLIIFFTQYRQTLHDLIAGTIVVDAKQDELSVVSKGENLEFQYLIDYWNSFNNIGKFCIIAIALLIIISIFK